MESLGKQVDSSLIISNGVDEGLLEAVDFSPSSELPHGSLIRLECTEFTSLCPVTSQPDFATIRINYVPAEKLVESKSLKLYLLSYRQHRAFHESCVHRICQALFELIHPAYIDVAGDFNSRGGISINPFVSMVGDHSPDSMHSFREARVIDHARSQH